MSQTMRAALAPLFVLLTLNAAPGQIPKNDDDALQLKRFFDRALTDKQAHAWLRTLCLEVGHRLSGSPGAAAAVNWGKAAMDTLGLDSVWLQPCTVPRWVRGERETCRISASKTAPATELNCLALGMSTGTGPAGIEAEIVEVKSLDALDQLGEAAVRGKIVFFSRPMDPAQIHTFRAYGGAVDQRAHGASRAGRLGARAVVVRSMASGADDWPHTGTLLYDTAISKAKIPAVAISTNDAELLSRRLRREPGLRLFIRTTCEQLADVPSFNVIGEIRGAERPGEFITVGGHLDSWDVGHGAHDDGTGCVQSMDVLFLMKKTGYRPRRTVRAVLFMNEENGGRGGEAYAAEARRKGEKHLAAIESDAGGFRPLGFGFDAEKAVFPPFFDKMSVFEDLFLPYGIQFNKGGGGSDIAPLKPQGTLLVGLQPDSQRYFDLHHTNNDVFSNVHPRELALGSAAMAGLAYLIDKYGL